MPILMTLAVLIGATQPTRPANPGRDVTLSWEQIESQAAQHRQLVRMCGPLSAARALFLLNHDIDLAAWLTPFVSQTTRGVSVRNVLQLCQQYEPRTKLAHVDGNSIHNVSFPCILLVNDSQHCIVAQSSSLDGIRVWDPSDLREKTIRGSDLGSVWNGDVILLRPQRLTSYRTTIAALLGVAIAAFVCIAIAQHRRVRRQAPAT